MPVVGNFSASQVEALKKLSADDWKTIWVEYRQWAKRMRSWPGWFWVLIGASGFASWIAWHSAWLLAPEGLAIFVLAKRAGTDEGYGVGYDGGFEAGVNRALSLTDEQAAELTKDAREAAVWDRIDAKKLRKPAAGTNQP